ncbi:MAG: tetratricopeptide repeat protein [Verrucomicrobiae bacterium]|nr:tetratricopeptide repeat protein [Verrucomicrobiae bacterium]
MSRFRNLEFEGQDDDASLTPQETVKDEAYYLEEARRAFETADFELGLRLYARALEENPRSPAAWTGQVRMLIELGEFREAKAWADKALEVHPNHAELLAAKAVALGRLGDLDEALALSDAAFEERGHSPFVWLARADVLLARREHRAEYCLDQAIGLAPRDWFVTWLAARVRIFHAQFAQALQLLRQSLEWDSTRFILWLQRGECELALGYADSARRSFEQALQINPLCSQAHNGRHKAQSTGLGRRFAGWWRRLFSR